ncbi:MAG: L-lactate transport, partial [Anaeromyxobacteraceae bacterium]|nr:L-lactate transport [Anaeromyxobacteraceae bacterium]
MVWTQIYAPVANSILISALVAAIPIILLLGALAFFHIKAHWAAVLGLVSAWAVAV